MTQESAKKELAKLISDYEEHRDQYLEKGYDEIKFRNNIVNRFFKIFGWDVDNTENLPEYNRDVIIHYKLKVRDSTTKPDYAFGLHAFFKPDFFVEAKTPATVIKDHKDSAHQIRRYGKSAELAVSILTNFEEFAVYDCTKLPKQSEAASFGRMEFFSYTQYLDNFDFFWNAISKEAVNKGNFQKHFKTDLLKKGSVPLDKGFVEKLNEWREDLATSIGLNNKRLSEEDINYAVQLIIDRMIFLRFCEDRNIEHLGTLSDAARKGITHNNLLEIYYNADKKYNSGLFDFLKDAITPKIKIDNKILKNIIEELYRPKTEYEFGVMPVEILGNVYEQFLGNIIKIYPSGKAKIVEKPEVKKAGGVFYTPQYIVEYIVDHTVGKLIKGKTPAQISKIKIVDPACGSGSFLLGAFVCLLKYHSDYYWKKGLHKKKNKNSPLTQDGKLTVAEKKRILINNLFGVDIDPNAVEVTKLSLLLKALEGETEESIYQQVKLFHERALPDLDGNIKCGNSLIGHDFFDGTLELDKEERNQLEKKVKPFEWKIKFESIFKHGGFDVVIGNPPYLSHYGRESIPLEKNQEKYLRSHYAFLNGFSEKTRLNSVMFFLEQYTRISNPKGLIGCIVDFNILDHTLIPIRKFISNKYNIIEIIDGLKVFKGVASGQVILLIDKKFSDNNRVRMKMGLEGEIEINPQSKIRKSKEYKWNVGDSLNLIEKIESDTKHLETKLKIITGVAVYATEEGRNKFILDTKRNNHCYPLLEGGASINSSYCVPKFKSYINYDKNLEKELNDIFERKYLKARGSHQRPFNLRTLADFQRPKIFLRQSDNKFTATYSDSLLFGNYSLFTLYDLENAKEKLFYILGLLNSKLMTFYGLKKEIIKVKKGKTPQIRSGQRGPTGVSQLPIREINFDNKKEKSAYDEIIQKVKTLFELKDDLRKAKRPDEIDRLDNRITHSENRIDELVYELYDLNKKDIQNIDKFLPQ